MKYDRWNIVEQPGHYVRGFLAFRSPRGDVRKHPRVCLALREKKGTHLSPKIMLSHIPFAGMEDAKHSEIFSGRRSGGDEIHNMGIIFCDLCMSRKA